MWRSMNSLVSGGLKQSVRQHPVPFAALQERGGFSGADFRNVQAFCRGLQGSSPHAAVSLQLEAAPCRLKQADYARGWKDRDFLNVFPLAFSCTTNTALPDVLDLRGAPKLVAGEASCRLPDVCRTVLERLDIAFGGASLSIADRTVAMLNAAEFHFDRSSFLKNVRFRQCDLSCAN